jgi:hypothetical protein
MAVIKRAGPRRGLSAGSAAVDMTKVNYTVVKDIGNAMKIAGKRRQKGDTFDAIPRHVKFLELEGVIAPTAKLAAAAAAASSASSSSSSSSTSSSSSSASDATSASASTAASTKTAKASAS